MRILGRPSSINVRKVLWTAREAGLDFVHEAEWGAQRDLRSAEFLAFNPNGRVPVLIDGDRVLWESNTICRYLAARSGRTDLLPDEPGARAEVEKWMDWQATDLNAAWRPAFMGLVRKSAQYSGDALGIERSVAQWNALMIMLDRRIGETGGYVAGEVFTLADIVLGLSLQRWLLTPIHRPSALHLQEYRERLTPRLRARGLDPDIP